MCTYIQSTGLINMTYTAVVRVSSTGVGQGGSIHALYSEHRRIMINEYDWGGGGGGVTLYFPRALALRETDVEGSLLSTV